ncbi:MAG: DNA repair protein RadA, partial [Candidatus Deferrimicrobium sp.]|nr:DNA repair protein RadA [Candidatus Deferrimicrobium sp.]
MAKVKVEFACTACGTCSPKWVGKCPGCGEWNTLVEEIASSSSSPRQRAGMPDFPASRPVRLTEVAETASLRTSCGIAEFDRVMGGGVVPASATLLGGDPGIGKSTILLQAARGLARHGKPVLYVSGEESEAQVKLRASRLGVTDAGIYLMSETSVERILSATGELSPGTLIVDSIQTVFSSDLPGAPGSVGQVRECAARLTYFGKKAGVSVFLVGHVTKEGAIAGPRVLEHIVDTVLYFEGEKGHPYRILKAVKNRFGSTNEIGVFEM